MKCIFCKLNSSSSQSEEHIIPESLGNKDHKLPPGIVCDKCNNYFSRKIEKKLLDQPYFKSLRFRTNIESKKGRFPPEKGVLINPLGIIEIHKSKDPAKQKIVIEDQGIIDDFKKLKKGIFVTPAFELPEKDNKIISRFLGKVGLEALASRLMDIEGGIEEIVNKTELDKIRNYVRYGNENYVWPYNLRRIYEEDKTFSSNNLEDYEILHEFTLLYTEKKELYFILTIMGVEFCINMGEPDLEGYMEWLKENKDKSPLDSEFCKNIDISYIG